MAISHVIDTADPDGSVKTISYLDDSIKQEKVDVKERMEDSIIDTTVTGWTTTVQKELIEGLARVFTNTRANKAGLTRLFDGKVFIATDADNTNAFEYYTGAAWAAIPIGTANLLADAVTTAKILAANVTTAKLAAEATFKMHANITNVTDDSVTNVTPVLIGTTSGDDFTVTITPNAAASVLVFALQCRPSLVSGAANVAGTLRIQNTTDATTVVSRLTNRQDKILDTDTNAREPFTMIGVTTGLTGAKTFEGQMNGGSAAQVIHLNGDEETARFIAFEFKL